MQDRVIPVIYEKAQSDKGSKIDFFQEEHGEFSCLRASPAWPESYWAVPGPLVQQVAGHSLAWPSL